MARSILAALFVLLAMWLCGCAERSAPPQSPAPSLASAAAEARIIAALEQVLQRDDSAFAIIEHPPSGKFVQFAGSKGEPLVLDLPAQALNAAERNRAEDLFSELGGTATAGGFLIESRDAKEAARMALRVFREVYLLPEDAEVRARVGS